MTLILRPPGRGNWQPITVTIDGPKHAPLPLEVHVGQRMELGGKTYRVCKVFS